jgi:hypothetical protein
MIDVSQVVNKFLVSYSFAPPIGVYWWFAATTQQSMIDVSHLD